MRRILLSLAVIATLAAPAAGAAQTDAHAEVLRTVTALFDGMRSGDSAQVRAAFHPDARLMTVGRRGGVPVVGTEAVDRFVAMVGEPRDAVLDERLHDVRVDVDGDMAVVWAPYRFYLGDRFSHCGVNSFQLARGGDGWKIVHLIDTRRREDCGEG